MSFQVFKNTKPPKRIKVKAKLVWEDSKFCPFVVTVNGQEYEVENLDINSINLMAQPLTIDARLYFRFND